MKKFKALFFLSFLLASALSENLQQYLESQGRLIEEQARKIAENAEREYAARQQQFQKEQDEVMEIVNQIQAGNIPNGVNSANTTSLSENVNGKILSVKNTIYSKGTKEQGAINIVQAIYEGTTIKDWSINSIIWTGNTLKKKLIQFSPQSGYNNFLSISGGNRGTIITHNGGVVTSSGGSSIIRQDGVTIQETYL